MPLEDLRTHSEWAETIKRGKQRIQCTTAGRGPTHQPWSHLPIGLSRSSSVSPESSRTNGVIAGRKQPQLGISGDISGSKIHIYSHLDKSCIRTFARARQGWWAAAGFGNESPQTCRELGFTCTAPRLFIRSQLKRLRPSFLSLCLLLKISSVPRFNHPEVLSSHYPRGVSLPWKEIGMPGGRQGRRDRDRGRVGSLLCSWDFMSHQCAYRQPVTGALPL